MWYQSLRSRSGSERSPPTGGWPTHKSFLRSFPSREYRERNLTALKLQGSTGSRHSEPNLSSTSRQLPASRAFPHSQQSPPYACSDQLLRIAGRWSGQIRSQARSCLPGSFPTPPHPTLPCDQHRLTTGRVCFSENTLHKRGVSSVRRCAWLSSGAIGSPSEAVSRQQLGLGECGDGQRDRAS